jgi:GntR family phosphonate transport system transcriptional regulator
MAALAAEGRVVIEQGRGTFVSTLPEIVYRIGRRTRFRKTLISQGVVPGREPISAEIVPAPQHVADVFSIETGDLVSRCLGRSLANNIPISLDCIWHCAIRFPDMSERRMRGESVTDIYLSHGIKDYLRRETTLSARNPVKWEARILQQPMDTPVIEQVKIDVTLDGTPIGYAESLWSAGRVRFLIDTNHKQDSNHE